MEELQVTSWKRFGHDRLYVNLPDGTSVAWADRTTGEITLVHPSYRDAVTDALARREPLLVEQEPVPPSRPPLRQLTPENDLAANRPGAALQALLDRSGPGLLRRAMARILNRPAEWEPWRTGLAGERRVAAELHRLAPQGWRVLHSVPLPRDVDIDHLLIGPGGVFSVGTEHHPGKAVQVGDEMVRINHGSPQPHALGQRTEANRVRGVLETHCGFTVPVQSVLVFVGVSELEVVATQLDVHVYQERQVSALGPLTGALTRTQADRVYQVARDRRSWLDA